MRRQEENLEHALKNQEAIKSFQVSEAYNLLITPIQESLQELKSSYDCKTLQEMASLKGERKGLKFVLDLLDQYEQAGIRAQETIEKQDRRRKLDEVEIDSTSL